MNLDQFIRPPLQTFIHPTPHPSECRGNAYPPEVRQMAVQNRLNGHDASAAHLLGMRRLLGDMP